MDQFENEERRQEPECIEPGQEELSSRPEQNPAQPVQNPDVGAQSHRKESPFADSPYVMNHQPRQTQGYYAPNGTYIPPVPPKNPPKNPNRAGHSGWKTALAALLTFCVIVGSCGITAALVNRRWEQETGSMIEDFYDRINEMQAQIDASVTKGNGYVYAGASQEGNLNPGQVYAKNVNSVVLITCEVASSSYGQVFKGQSSGSGFVLTSDGYVVTNHHVVEGASRITVTFHDGTVFTAKLIGSDSANDVAVLKVDAGNLTPVAVGSSAELAVGDQVVAIGNPLGELTSTMTAGYVSAKDRDVTTDGVTISMIQTDVAINSGNSGGPLFNMKGEVIGITTAKYSGSSSSGASIEGIGFAIPMDDVMPLIQDLMEHGYVTGAYLGVLVSNMDEEAASYYGMPVGVYVQEVTEGYCAEKAGLQAKDIIVALGDHEVRNLSMLTRALRKFQAGDSTTITVYRGGRELVLPVTLDEKPAANESVQIPSAEEMPKEGSYEEWFNFFAPFFGQGKD